MLEIRDIWFNPCVKIDNIDLGVSKKSKTDDMFLVNKVNGSTEWGYIIEYFCKQITK